MRHWLEVTSVHATGWKGGEEGGPPRQDTTRFRFGVRGSGLVCAAQWERTQSQGTTREAPQALPPVITGEQSGPPEGRVC